MKSRFEHNESLFADISKKANFCLFSLSCFPDVDLIQSLNFCISCFFQVTLALFLIISPFCDGILKEMESQENF